jgi:release factor glutamine methyltransferase
MQWDGLFIATHRDVYEPSDDTFLLARVVANHVGPGTRFLEVGCGTGLVSLVAARAGAQVTCTDANAYAVRLARENAKQNGLRMDAIEADLLRGLVGPYDVVAFNPPYLPTGPDDKVDGPLNLAFDGGPDGNAVALRFATQLGALRPLPATVLVVHSSLSDPEPLATAMARLGYRRDVAARESHFQEQLTVQRFQKQQ